jgi:hypothetical protein
MDLHALYVESVAADYLKSIRLQRKENTSGGWEGGGGTEKQGRSANLQCRGGGFGCGDGGVAC